MARGDVFQGGQDRASIEGRFNALAAGLRRLAAEYGQQAVTQAVQVVAKTVSTLNYSDLQNIPAEFNPSPHASTHAAGGSDELTPGDIDAYTKAEVDAKVTFGKTLRFDGAPSASQLDWRLIERAGNVSGADPGSAYARTNPSDGDWVADVQLNGASQGSVTISVAGVVTWGLSYGFSVAVGDRLEVIAPATPDSTAADIQIVFKVLPA